MRDRAKRLPPWRAEDRKDAAWAANNAGSRHSSAPRRCVRSPDVSGGWNKKTQAAGIGARAGSGDAMEVAVRDHGGAAAAMAAGIREDRLAQIEQVE